MGDFSDRLQRLAPRRRLPDDNSSGGARSCCVAEPRASRFQKLLLVGHPFLVAVLPVLWIFVPNYAETEGLTALYAVVVVLAATALLLLVARFLSRDLLRAACLVSLFNALFFSYGRAYDALSVHKTIITTNRELHIVLGALSVLVLAGTAYYLRTTRRDLRPLARFLTGTLAILLLFPLGQIASHELGFSKPRPKAATARRAKPPKSETATPGADEYPRVPPQEADSPDLPDIYYIILDAYCRADVLQNVFGHDNAEFLDYLRSRGFYVAGKSCANYPYTMLSLPSSMNMRYLDEELEQFERGKRQSRSSYANTFQSLTARPLVGEILQSKGYRFIFFRTNVWVTKSSDAADTLVGYYPEWLQDEFTQVVLRTTPLRVNEPSMAKVHLHAFAKLKEIPAIPGPKFTFAHLVIPHAPFVFDRHGNIRDLASQELQQTKRTKQTARDEYLDQLIYLNTRMREIIEHILATSRSQPIIIVQGDHGFDSLVGGTKDDPPVDWDLYSRERLPILNAYLVPEKAREKLYPSISPVNSFRVLLTECFGEQFELLPDINYIGWYNDRFLLRNATELVTTKGAPPPDAAKIVDGLAAKRKADARR